MSRIRDYSLSGEERKTRLRVCIFDAAGVKSAFALLLTKVTKPSLGNLLICAVADTITDKKEVYAYIGKDLIVRSICGNAACICKEIWRKP